MWIRSQDRKKLTEIHDVTIYHDKQIWVVVHSLVNIQPKKKL